MAILFKVIDTLQIVSCCEYNFVIFKTQSMKYTWQMSLRKVASEVEKCCVGGSEHSEHRRGAVHSMYYARITIVISIYIMGFKILEFKICHSSLIKCKMKFRC